MMFLRVGLNRGLWKFGDMKRVCRKPVHSGGYTVTIGRVPGSGRYIGGFNGKPVLG